MPKTKRTDWKAIAAESAESVEREQHWKGLVAEREQRIADLEGGRAALIEAAELAARSLERPTREARLLRRQGEFLKAHCEQLAQRYAGAKIDTQQMTLAQAQQWFANEQNGLNGALQQIEDQHNRVVAAETASQAQRQELAA